ncbi:MAG: hemolysin family protein [Desulfomicrobium sp.]|nr:hemolysin family protein [Desulfomicrobium sp.]NLV96164.1 HlyC/CorC family transporter [Desulfovibrionales bacterium]
MIRSTGFLFLVLLLVLANGFFVASEFSLVAVRRSRIATLAEEGNKRAKLLLRLIDHLNAYISATQLGITLASLALGWIGEPAIARLLTPVLEPFVSPALLHSLSFAITFSFITFLHIVIGELAPKTIALELAEKTALAVALPLEIFYRLFYWPIRLLDWAGTRTVRLLGLRPDPNHSSIYTEEELRMLIDASYSSGQIEEDKRRLVRRAFDFDTTEAHEAMVPRSAITALPVSAPLEEVLDTFQTHGYSRLPVYGEDLDDVLGVLFRQDMEPFLAQKENLTFSMTAQIHPPIFVPAGKRLGSLLKQMQATRTHLVFVMDEYGGLEGMITLEDVLEEIVGEISDEYDEEVRSQIVRDGKGFVLDGMLAVRDFNRKLNLTLTEDDAYTTIAGFLLAQAGRVLDPGDEVRLEEGVFQVERVEKRRIQRIRFTPTPVTEN